MKHKKLLIDALLSGKYKQATGNLRDSHGFCCLGVACDVYRKETGKGRWKKNGFGGEWEFLVKGEEPKSADLPDVVANWFGCANNGGMGVDTMGCVSSLMGHNDAGRSFEEIARMIKEQK